jgi:predicted small secreted protein
MKPFQLTILLAAAAAISFSTSCATTRGFGQDLQKVGNKLENQADSTGGAAPAPASTGIYTPPPSTVVPSAY